MYVKEEWFQQIQKYFERCIAFYLKDSLLLFVIIIGLITTKISLTMLIRISNNCLHPKQLIKENHLNELRQVSVPNGPTALPTVLTLFVLSNLSSVLGFCCLPIFSLRNHLLGHFLSSTSRLMNNTFISLM